MQRILQLLKPLLVFSHEHPASLIFFAVSLAVLSGFYAIQLKIDTDIANLLPDSYESVQALEKLKETVGGETPLEVVIQSPSFEANKEAAQFLIDTALTLYDDRTQNNFFSRAEFRKETEVLENNALYIATERELESIKAYLKDEIEEAKLEANPFYFSLDEDDEEEGAEEEISDISRFEESYETLVPSEYPVNEDSTIVVVKLFPTGSKSDLEYLNDMFGTMDQLTQDANFDRFHPKMEVAYGGRLQRHLAQFESIMNDVFSSFATGIGSVMLLVMLYFFVKKFWYASRSQSGATGFWSQLARSPIPVMAIGLPLIISLCYTFGLTYLYLGSLNTMTSVLFVILFGLGIDYGIHFYARYIELRSAGKEVIPAIETTYETTGTAILTSGLTTAVALYVMMFADFKGFSEFGFISGTGILLALLAMLYLLPPLLVLFERFGWIVVEEQDDADVNTDEVGDKPIRRYPYARAVVLGGFAVAILVLLNVDKLSFQYKFGELEPDFPRYEQFRDLTSQTSNSSRRNPAYIIANTNEQVLQILDTLRHRMRTDTLSPTIDDVEALQERFPQSTEEAQQKLEEIARIRELLQDPFLRDQDDPQLEKLRKAAQTVEPLSLSQIPDYLKEKFITKSGELGKFVIIYPSVGLSDARNSIAFKNDIQKVTLESGKTFYAASTSLVAARMLELMRDESPYMVSATFVLVLIFTIMAFRSAKWSLIAMIPLVIGLVWTFGIMMLTGMMFNFYNLVVLPAILGIGTDNGVHLAHRYREEGRGSMWEVLSSTGQHITIGSITTILGFFGLLFTHHPGLQSIGQMAMLGIGMTLLSGLILLPALVQWLEDKDWIDFEA